MGSLDKENNKFLKGEVNLTNGEVELLSGIGIEGAWFEIFASTTIMGNYLQIIPHDASAATDFNIDIALGESGSEVPYLENIKSHISTAAQNIVSIPYNYKVSIPKGSRVSARCLNAAAETIDIDTILTGV